MSIGPKKGCVMSTMCVNRDSGERVQTLLKSKTIVFFFFE